ncbi:MAG: TauD/TfdA family dioxygenase [Burkholderiaceae bacterium]|nr:TauD/TfdA family dioxygenase [Burkholderiaceae bacterium]
MSASQVSRVEGGPFSLEDDRAYRAWRDWKLEHAPASAQALIVEVRDPKALSASEREAIVARCRVANMAVYASPARGDAREAVRLLGAQLGLRRLDANWLADEDGVSSLSTAGAGGAAVRGEYIPYTDRPIRWHTDGYYNPPERRIDAMVLHCARAAASGGENRVLDHEIAYIRLRELDPAHVAALVSADAMRIPQRAAVPGESGAGGKAREARTGPVFSLREPGGDLHMRYTARTRSIEWSGDEATRAAVAALSTLLAAETRHAHSLRMEPGMGLVCNNVLHDRSGFSDTNGQPRLMLRARYLDRIEGTRFAWRDARYPIGV